MMCSQLGDEQCNIGKGTQCIGMIFEFRTISKKYMEKKDDLFRLYEPRKTCDKVKMLSRGLCKYKEHTDDQQKYKILQNQQRVHKSEKKGGRGWKDNVHLKGLKHGCEMFLQLFNLFKQGVVKICMRVRGSYFSIGKWSIRKTGDKLGKRNERDKVAKNDTNHLQGQIHCIGA